jgi:ATP-binding cassette subfamily B protein
MADLTRIFWNNRADAAAALVQQSKIGDGAEINTTPLFGGDLSRTLQRSGLALLDLGERGVLTILGVGKRNATLLTRDLGSRRLRTEELLDLVVAPHSANLSLPASLSGRIAPRARRTLLCERLREVRLGTVTMLTRHPGTNFVRQLRDAGLIRTLGAFATAHALETMLWLIVWWAAGKAALSGRIDSGWMQGWGLLIAVLVPVRMWATWSQGKFSVGASGLLKQRLLAGALRLEPGQVAQEGAGKFFSRVTEADSLETLALSGGLMSAVSVLELAVAAAVLGLGANGASLIALLALWIGLTAIAMWRYARARARWTTARLALTHDAVEQMSGHRTRLAQEPPERRHTNEDAVLENYHALSDTMDRWGVRLTALVPRGWLLAGLAGLLPAFLGGANPADLAIGLGGILLAWQALRRLSAGATHLAGAALAWKSVAPLFDAAGRAASETKPPRHVPDSAPARTVLDAADLAFRYREGGRAVLDGVDLRIERGDWVLLEGASGGGKSTLVSMLAGLRQPSAGLLTSGGLDRRALGEQGWRKRIAAAPQYHENHILTGSLAFNLLMGRTWPPSQQDLTEAAALCRELGLGPLLERMPAGLHQVVGETGWQLSQGERSRVFLARAILQNSEMVILDESFAALDPENLRRSMECALQRTNTLLVVAHP